MNQEQVFLIRLTQTKIIDVAFNTAAASFWAAWMADQEDLFGPLPQASRAWDDPRGVDLAIWRTLRKAAHRRSGEFFILCDAEHSLDLLCELLEIDILDRIILNFLFSASRWHRVSLLFSSLSQALDLDFSSGVAYFLDYPVEWVKKRLSPDSALSQKGIVVANRQNYGDWQEWKISPLFELLVDHDIFERLTESDSPLSIIE